MSDWYIWNVLRTSIQGKGSSEIISTRLIEKGQTGCIWINRSPLKKLESEKCKYGSLKLNLQS